MSLDFTEVISTQLGGITKKRQKGKAACCLKLGELQSQARGRTVESQPIQEKQRELEKQVPTPAGATDHWSAEDLRVGYRTENRGHQPMQR